MSKNLTNPIKLPPHERVRPIQNQPDYSRVSHRIRHQTIDVSRHRKNPSIDNDPSYENSEAGGNIRRGKSNKPSLDGDSLAGTKRTFRFMK